ncbi:MAG: hypothetical protein HYV63_09675 [Candidatus Schekmanbacteria bacterium]|nr:hypothetical protein [Candidatus Schekmanbacteria bacterium]
MVTAIRSPTTAPTRSPAGAFKLPQAAATGLPRTAGVEPGQTPAFVVELSPQARVTPPAALAGAGGGSGPATAPEDAASGAEEPGGSQAAPGTDEPADAGQKRAKGHAEAATEELPADQRKEVEELEKTDREVRQHEAAHKAAAGGHARGGPQFTFQVGPDGKRYAVGGEVKVDMSPVPGDPAATIQKMSQIRRAALAPRDPSAADRSIAARAARVALDAREDLRQEQADKTAEAAGRAASTKDSATAEEAASAPPEKPVAPPSPSSEPQPAAGFPARLAPEIGADRRRSARDDTAALAPRNAADSSPAAAPSVPRGQAAPAPVAGEAPDTPTSSTGERLRPATGNAPEIAAGAPVQSLKATEQRGRDAYRKAPYAEALATAAHAINAFV